MYAMVRSYTAHNASPRYCSKRFSLYSLTELFSGTVFRLLWESLNHGDSNAQRLFGKTILKCLVNIHE